MSTDDMSTWQERILLDPCVYALLALLLAGETENSIRGAMGDDVCEQEEILRLHRENRVQSHLDFFG